MRTTRILHSLTSELIIGLALGYTQDTAPVAR